MKPVLWIAVMLLTGCVNSSGGDLSGRHEKNGEAVRVERLGAVTTSSLPGELRCGSKQVMWCAGGRSQESCKCLYVTEAENKVRRMADQLKSMRFPNP